MGVRAGANREILDFLRTGVLEWRPLGPCTRVRYVAPGGPPPVDWVGLNYYSRVVMDWRCQVRPVPSSAPALAASKACAAPRCLAGYGPALLKRGWAFDSCPAPVHRMVLSNGEASLLCTICYSRAAIIGALLPMCTA